MSEYPVFTSEAVSTGHPDKVADQISDAVLDLFLETDPNARVAVETLVKGGLVTHGGETLGKNGLVMLAGETRSERPVETGRIEERVRQTVVDIGYDRSELGFDGRSCEIFRALSRQSADISRGVDRGELRKQGAGDQGMVFGYASDETDSLMPAPIHYARLLMTQQAKLRQNGALPWLRPDAKSQLSIRYKNGKPHSVDAVVFSTQHEPEIEIEELRREALEKIIQPTLPADWLHKDTRCHINPTCKFVTGGPQADCGLTGRKIIVDTYGGMARHGGGAFSGKDPSKVDRSAAYAARHVAKNIVAAGLARRCEVQISYAIGVAQPTSVSLNTFDTGVISDQRIRECIDEVFDLRPGAIICNLDLLRPIYRKTAAYGHFGHEEFPWERCDRSEELRECAGVGARDLVQ